MPPQPVIAPPLQLLPQEVLQAFPSQSALQVFQQEEHVVVPVELLVPGLLPPLDPLVELVLAVAVPAVEEVVFEVELLPFAAPEHPLVHELAHELAQAEPHPFLQPP